MTSQITHMTHTQVYVLDQDEALEFYVGKLGFEPNADFDLGFMRWLSVNPPGRPDHELLLLKPGAPAFDEATTELLKELVTKGAMPALFFATGDAHKAYDDLAAKGVDLVEKPTERPYGIDFGARDPFGNPFRICQVVEGNPDLSGYKPEEFCEGNDSTPA